MVGKHRKVKEKELVKKMVMQLKVKGDMLNKNQEGEGGDVGLGGGEAA